LKTGEPTEEPVRKRVLTRMLRTHRG
jgi:hypothetical protein